MNFSPLVSSLFGCILLGMCSCSVSSKQEKNLVTQLLSGSNEVVERVMTQPEKYRVQILYTQIDRDENQQPTFTSHRFRLNPDEYFYPASTVKFPAALMALETFNHVNSRGWDFHATMLTDSARPSQTPAYQDLSALDSLPSLAHYIRKIFLVSDNDAYNRLYEFVGQGPLNRDLYAKGYEDLRLVHRLSIFLPPEENRHTNPVRFTESAGPQLVHPAAYNEPPIPTPAPILLGKGEVVGDSTLMRPKDFATKNYFPLQTQQDMLKALFFPESVPDSQRFNLKEEQREWVYRSMGEFPRESTSPVYPSETYYDSYVKFLMYGDRRDRLPDHIRIFNKIGVAYGFVTDNAYIVDWENGVEFMLSATIFTNENGIFNDGVYEYEEIAEPFMGELGRKVYEYELGRKRVHKPDLSYWKGLLSSEAN